MSEMLIFRLNNQTEKRSTLYCKTPFELNLKVAGNRACMSSEKIMAWLHENSTLSSKLRSATNYAATTLTKTYEGSLTTLIPPSPFFTEKICENCFAENSFSDNFLEPLYFPSFNLCCMLVQFTYNTTSGCHFWEKAFMIVLISQEKKTTSRDPIL